MSTKRKERTAVTISCALSRRTADALQKRAVEDDRSRAAIIRIALAKFLDLDSAKDAAQ